MVKKSTSPLVSVVILNWNGLENTKQCLESISKQTYNNIELVVIDNGSVDGSKEYLKTLTNIVYVDNPKNRGFTGGHIDGLHNSNGEFIMLLNNDAVVDPHYIERALQHFHTDAAVAAVGGRAYFWNNDQPPYNTNNNYYSYQTINTFDAEAISNQTDKGYVQEVNNVSGSCVIVRRTVVNEVGYLYEPFFAYYEETDLFARIKRAGYKVIYDPQLAIWHQDGSSSSSYFQYYQLFKNRFTFACRNFETYYLLRFFKAYIKTGLLMSVYKFKRNEHQTLHKAFSRAFLRNCIMWPSALLSRRALTKQLGKSTYNHKIAAEQNGVSFVMAVSEHTDIPLLENHWERATSLLPVCELILVITSPKLVKKYANTIKKYPNIKIVTDKKYFDGHELNLGWLSATHNLVYFGSLSTLPSLEQLLPAIAELSTKGKVAAVWGNRGEIRNGYYNSSLHGNFIFRRDLLALCGGLDKDLELSAAYRRIVLYAQMYYGKKRILAIKDPDQAELLPTVADTRTFSQGISNQVKRDKTTNKARTAWARFLEKYYRVYQIRNTVKWFFSLKVSPRIKLARTRNLIIFAVKLDRTSLATELKHMRNEVVKLSFYGLGLEDKEKHIRASANSLLENANWRHIPIFIICRDRLDPLLQLVEWLESKGFEKIIFIDNDSIYPPLVKYLQESPYQVIFTGRNTGHTVMWDDGIVKTLCSKDFYIVNDPDVIPAEDCPEDILVHFLKLHKKYIEYQKVGFGLKIDDLPDYFALKNSVIDWETQFWKHGLEENVYEAGVDTTFALYKPFTYTYMLHPSIRTGEPYVARHLPWYNDSNRLSGEEVFYRDRVNQKITSWNVDELPERYQKELNLNT